MTLLNLFAQSPILGMVFLISIVAAVTVHEFAHAWTATQLGDDTPRLQGRVTLSPGAHLDLFGSIAFLLLGFGWGKPVEYNPMRLKRQTDELVIALAGPASNLLFALVLNSIIHFTPGSAFGQLLGIASSINVLLAAFNVIPIPPLDGSSVVAYFWPEYRSLVGGQIGTVILLLIIFMPIGGGNLLASIISPLEAFFGSITHLFGLL